MIPEDELRQMYLGDKMTQIEIAELVGVSDVTIGYWMRGYGIKSRTHSESLLINTLKPSNQELSQMYHNKKMSQPEIAKEIGVSYNAIFRWMKDYGIESRTVSESVIGENNSRWKGGVSFEPYCNKFNNFFKEAVRRRDDYICQLCGCNQNGRKLDVHHIHYDKSDCWPDVVALCRSCNSKVNSNRNCWEQYFENHLFERGLTCWSILQE